MAKGNPKYNVYLGLNFDDYTKGARDAARVGKKIDRILTSNVRSSKDLEIGLKKLQRMRRDGKISAENSYRVEQKLRYEKHRAEQQTIRYTEATNKEVKAHKAATNAMRLRIRMQQAQNRGQRAQVAAGVGLAGAGASALGLGGRGAGIARTAAGAAGLGGMSIAGSLGVGASALGLYGTYATGKKSLTLFMELEQQIAKMKVLFGEDIALPLVDQFRELAKTTPLTTQQLLSNAAIWKSYGNTTEGIVDRMRRLGEVAGGNTEKFKLLTMAFAQVNAVGHLMGQEKNQLINAGMNLKAIADEAGISMDDFASAMEKGEIKASHLNDALVTMTSEGGSHFGFLDAQANTLSGKFDVLNNKWNEFLTNIGESGSETGILQSIISTAETAIEMMEKLNAYFEDGKVRDAKGNVITDPTASSTIAHVTGGTRGDIAETKRSAVESTFLAGITGTLGFEAFMDSGSDPYSNPAYAAAVRAQAEANQMYGAGRGYLDDATAEIERGLNRDGAGAKNNYINVGKGADVHKEARYRILGMASGQAEEARKEQLRREDRMRLMGEGQSVGVANLNVDLLERQREFEKALYNGVITQEEYNYGLGKLKEGFSRRIATQNKVDKLNEAQARFQEQIKAGQKKAKEDEQQIKEDEKNRLEKLGEAYEADKALIMGPKQGGADFKGGSVEEFKYVSEMQKIDRQETLLRELDEKREQFEQRIHEEAQAKLEDVQSKLDDQTQRLETKIENLQTAVASRE